MKESNIQKLIMLALSEAGCTVWRNNVGVLPDRNGVPIRFGLCVGSCDLIGMTPSGQFLAVEVKACKGRATMQQLAFIDLVKRLGGIAGICRSPQDALELIRRG